LRGHRTAPQALFSNEIKPGGSAKDEDSSDDEAGVEAQYNDTKLPAMTAATLPCPFEERRLTPVGFGGGGELNNADFHPGLLGVGEPREFRHAKKRGSPVCARH